MHFQFVFFWTDILVYILLAIIVVFAIYVAMHEHLRGPWREVARRKLGMAALVVLSVYVVAGLLDSVHFRTALAGGGDGQVYYSTHVKSLLDVIINPIGQQDERSYSAPFATHAYSKSIVKTNGIKGRDYPRLLYGGSHLNAGESKALDMTLIALWGVLYAIIIWLLLVSLIIFVSAKRARQTFRRQMTLILKGKTFVAWREILITLAIILLIMFISLMLAKHYHIFGTDKVGKDVFFATIKSIRTGLLIGTLTTLFMLPFALLLGPMAGYFSGIADDIIQYIYTTLSSIPGVLLISAAVLSLQVFIHNHPHLFPTLAERADARLLALCVILGITSWTSLCRLLRAETLKLREIDFVKASQALGVSHLKIITRHILPNMMHIVLITVVLDFSGLVLAEAVLSYVGVGVDPTTMSWGNMINSARLELAREPVVWWPLLAAFIYMFVLVLSANLFADSVRDAFDPRLRK